MKFSFLLALVLFVAMAVSGVERSHEMWFFQGDGIPAAPQQNQPWQPPETSIPAEYVAKIAAAFKHGLADPRNCEYREVEVPMGRDSGGRFFRSKTHGWLLPGNDKQSQQFAILWDGLIYPVISIGSAASIQDDIQQLCPIADREVVYRFPEIFTSVSSNYGAVCALLLRLGEVKLAEKAYPEATKSGRIWNDDIQKATLWSMFSRALGAHMYGDDKLALCYAEQYESLLGEDEGDFTSTARELLVEQRRRAGKQSKAKNEIDAMILDLESVDARQVSQPGIVPLGYDKRVQALIAVGDAAVEPLLECMENDQRLTRSVGYQRSFYPRRTIITVSEAAYMALSGIMQQSFFKTVSTSDSLSIRGIEYRRKVAQQIRAHYNRYKNMSYEEKWYHILQNNDEPVDVQLQAAEHICREIKVNVIPDSSPQDTSVQLAGEVLRSKNNPSVSELLNRRAVEYLPDAASPQVFNHAQRMARFSAEWDLPNSLPALQEVSNAIYRELLKDEYFKVELFELLVQLTIHRVKAGDKAALQQYCETLLPRSEQVIGGNSGRAWEVCMKPLYTFPEEAVAITTAEAIFDTPGNGWSEYFGKFKDARRIENWLFAKFMRLASYRKHVRRGLDNKGERVKWETIIKDNWVEFNSVALDRSGSGSYGYSAAAVKNDPLFPGNNTTQILRVCDIFAKALSDLKDGGYPAFQNYWEEKDRDRAIEQIALKLSQ